MDMLQLLPEILKDCMVIIVSVSCLVSLVFVVCKLFIWDSTENDSLNDAEWMIIEHCNESKGCTECDRFLKDKGCCRYQFYAPWQWRKDE